MSPLLSIQLVAWFVAAIGAAVALSQYFSFRKKESRLPAACELEDLDARVEKGRKTLLEIEDQAEKARENGRRELFEIEDKAQRALESGKRALLEIEEKAEKAREKIGEAVQKIAELEELRRWHREQTTELEKVAHERQEQEALRASIKGLQNERSTLLAELGRLQADQATASANLVHLGTQRANLAAELDELRKRLEETTRLHNDKQLQLNLTQNELNLRGLELKRLEENCAWVDQSLQKAKEAFEQKLQEIDTSKRELAAIECSRHALEQECLRLKSEIDSLNKWKETLTALLQKLQANVDRIDPQASRENRYRDLWAPCSFPLLALNRSPGTEDAALATTERYLKSHGLHYPKRVLHAFHTALKTADMSPLVVLAGISGTGKSLLPKRYAEAMGMHFVSLAVQPRWDSPQDLFGFFNHLEGRFKATDLARAMVQFERFNRRAWEMPKGWNHGREDRMLLVLLDEMNLARVEYYFSEFLSKLETRRDVDESDPFDRAKAEIALEMGSLRENERAIRLYPSRNVLFAGTMNEDESTQSLSDKVVDRACVLRFGRPQALDRTGAPTTSGARQATAGIGFDTWSKWCDTSLSDSDERRMNEWIAKLNDGMDALGKPFAHRVHQAILAYARNYPDVGRQDRLRLALADQIEQRILPKLRGVEIEGNDEALELIEKVIIEADDRELAAAFRRGMDTRAGTFLWRGLDRSEQ